MSDRAPDQLAREVLNDECRRYLAKAAQMLDCAVQLGAGEEVIAMETRLDALAAAVPSPADTEPPLTDEDYRRAASDMPEKLAATEETT